MDQSMEVLNF